MLGILLFIISELMLFGAFFAAMFFIRVVAETRLAPGRRPAGRRRRHERRDPAVLVGDDALDGHLGPPRQHVFGMQAGIVTTFLLGATFLFVQINEYLHLGFNPKTNASASVFFGLTGLHGAHVVIGLLLLFMSARAHLQGQGRPGEPQGPRGRRHLLALRRRHVGRRLHDDLPARVARDCRSPTVDDGPPERREPLLDRA